MIDHLLRAFIDGVLENRKIEAADVNQLRRTILPDGVTTRDEADVLIALDRAVADADPSWVEFLVTSIVDFVVWTTRPTGYVGRDNAHWLVASLGCGSGPTRNAKCIAFEVIRDAEQVDEALLAFALRGARRKRENAAADRGLLAA